MFLLFFSFFPSLNLNSLSADCEADERESFYHLFSTLPVLHKGAKGKRVLMPTQYRVLIELDTEDQVQEAYKCLKSEEELQPSQGNHQSGDKAGINSNSKDWRIGQIGISGISKAEMSLMMKGKSEPIVSEFLGHGIIRLFKTSDAVSAVEECNLTRVQGDDTMVSILFVPTYLTAHELLQYFLGDGVVSKISHFRILRNFKDMGFKFMVLMKFRDSLSAKNFKEEFNGKKFNAMDPETCHVVYIKEVVFKKRLLPEDCKSDFPYLLHDPFTNELTTKGIDREFPSCPVCLERMDSDVTGLITIPCQHTFHCQCLDKWKDSRCPVCRYSNLKLTRGNLLKQGGNACSICGATDSLWMCLICGNVGCGRYNSKHAIQHYENTSHCFAMDIATQRVWDYAGDNYVHRLIQNEVDGKLVEVGSSSREGGNMKHNKEYHLEYVQVLISQLESQREYYESKLQQTYELIDTKKDKTDDIKQLQESMRQLKLQVGFTQEAHRGDLERLENELKGERLVTKGLQENLDHITKKYEKLQKDHDTALQQKQDLQEQVTDLMFYLESQEKFKDADESVKEGTIIVKPRNQTSAANKKKNKKKTSKR